MTDNVEDFLAHYGVPGMKWGRRKGTSSSSSASTAKKDPAHSDAVLTKEIRVKAKTSGTDSLSNAQLQTAITRMNLETQYSRLSPASKSKGQKIATDILSNTGKQLASEYAKSAAKKGVEMALKAAMSR